MTGTGGTHQPQQPDPPEQPQNAYGAARPDGSTSRYERGVELMRRVQGEAGAAAILDGFDAVSPDFGRYVVEAGFADVYGRPGLTLAQRQLLNVGVLTALGGAEPQLAVHIRGALNVGVTPEEILEAVFHVALYAGHPRAGNALRVAREVFDEYGVPRPDAARETHAHATDRTDDGGE